MGIASGSSRHQYDTGPSTSVGSALHAHISRRVTPDGTRDADQGGRHQPIDQPNRERMMVEWSSNPSS
jgi:hypothetical protein